MGKLANSERDGLMWVSDNGIEYDLLEGLTLGSPRYASDILFIMFNRYDAKQDVVYWMYGAEGIEDEDEYFLKVVNEVVNEWEGNHKDIVSGIKDGTIKQY